MRNAATVKNLQETPLATTAVNRCGKREIPVFENIE